MVNDDDVRPCPTCNAPSPYEPPETFQGGLLDSIVPTQPDSWWCPTHGRWTDQRPPQITAADLL